MGRSPRLVAALILAALVATGPASAQTTAPPPTPPGQAQPPDRQAPPDLTTDIERIKEGLSRPQVLKVQQDGLRFYLQIVGKRMDLGDYLRNSDLLHAPVPGAGVTHQDFINHITPKLLYSSGGIKAAELLEWGIVNWLGKMGLKKLFSELGEARREAEVRRIRDQIDRELAALRGKSPD